jgi:acyl dehydratase
VTVLHRVRAHNLAATSANKIHDDEVARRYGFAGGLVPGVDVYAYMTHPVVAHFGPAWLSDGSIHVRLAKPVYDGGCVTVERARGEALDAALVLVVRDEAGQECATGRACLGAGAPPDMLSYGRSPLPDPRPAASTESLRPGAMLGTVDTVFRASSALEYLGAIGETLPLYREASVAHPGWLLRRANRVLADNVSLGPWIHVESDVRLFGVARDGDGVSTRARVRDVWERRDHKFVSIDVLVVVGDERPVMHTLHTAIYEPRPRQ